MVDVGHGINSIIVCLQEATPKIKRSISSSLKYLHSRQAAERNSNSEREALSEKHQEDAMKPLATQNSREANFLWELPKYVLLMATLAAGVSYSSGGSPPGGLWSDNDGAHLAEDRVLRVTFLRRYRAVFYYFTTAFVASIFNVSSLRWWLWILGLFCIMGAFGTSRSCWRLAISALFERDGGKKVASEAPETLEGVRWRLVMLAGLVAVVTYQAGLEPPRSLWQANAKDGLHHYRPGEPIMPHTTYPPTYQAFFYFNATAFAASVFIFTLLLSNICRTRGIEYCASQVAMTQDLPGLIGAYAGGSCSESDPASVDKDDPNSPIKRTPREATWRVACAAPHHMTGNRSLLLTGGYLPMRDGNDGEVVMVHPATNGEAVPLQVRGSGSVRTESISLDDVWYVPGLDSNLVSTGQLARQGCAVNLGPGGCRITRGGALVGTARFTEACQFELDFLKVA